MNKCFLLLSLMFSNFCFSGLCIQPLKYDDQLETLVNGGSVIESNKINAVSMFQTSEMFENRKANFNFGILNRSEVPINFHVYNLRVTDQFGRPLKIVPRKKLVSNKKSSRNFNSFISSLQTCNDLSNAREAGKIDYHTHTHENYHSHHNSYGSHGFLNASTHAQSASTTVGHVEVGALRHQAERQVRMDAERRDSAIQANYEDWKYSINNFYFDSTTIFPGTVYSTNFQIDMPKEIEKDLQYLFFTYYLGGEEHTFCFYCWKNRR